MNNFAEMLQQFARVREEKGQEAFEAAVHEFAAKVVDGGDGLPPGMADAFMKQFQADQAEAQKKVEAARAASNAKAEAFRTVKPTEAETDAGFLRVIQQSLPAMKSQAQFNAFMASFEALRGLMNSIFAGNQGGEAEFRKALDQSIDAARKMTELTEKLSDVPEAAESKLAEEFKRAPRQFTEKATQEALLAELAGLADLEQLTRWWAENRVRIDEVVTPALRNPLIDAVRDRKAALTAH